MSKPTTLYDKIWDDHLVHEADDGTCLLYIDRHLVHEVTSPQAFEGLRITGRKVRAPEKTLAVVDHNVPTTDRSQAAIRIRKASSRCEALAENAKEFGIEYFDEFDKRQGIVHVIGPEQGFTLPGTTIVCGDSHTSTHGAFGALAHGIGTSEVEHVLATQTLIQKKAKNMRVAVDGKLPDGVTAKDIILAIIGEIGTAGGTGYVHRICRRGDPRAVDGRPHDGLQHVDRRRRPRRPGRARRKDLRLSEGPPEIAEGRGLGRRDALLGDAALRRGRAFRHEIALDAAKLPPIVTWGTSPEDVVSITGMVPDPDEIADEAKRALEAARAGLYGPEGRHQDHRHQARPRLHRLLHQWPHRGSARRRRRSPRARPSTADVNAMVVPGSGLVKEQAEAEGLDKIFIEAGFEWREPGCSMCLAMNPDKLSPEERCASTSNRNFEGRQGFKGRTHLVSPAMAAAAAIAGHFVDVREWK